MAQTNNQRRAADAVAARMAHLEWNNTQLVAATGADPGTIGDFLNGKRWPKLGTQGKIERALSWAPGTLRTIAAGGPAPEPADNVGAGRQTGDHQDDMLRFRRPDGLTDQQWERVRGLTEEFIAWEIERTSRGR
jgi:hypothetical protein